MGFRFRRRIKLFPGVTLNLNKTGVSVSAGVRGAKVTVGKKGVRQTIGLPGTGLSHTTYTKFGNISAPRTSSYTPSSGQSRSNMSASDVIIVIGVLLLIILAATKPIFIPALVVIFCIVFVLNRKNNISYVSGQTERYQTINYSTNVVCPKCYHSFAVEKKRFPDIGRDFTCSKYLNSFFALPTKDTQMDNVTVEFAIFMVKIVNESLKIANESEHYETRIYKTKVAKDNLAKLKEISRSNPEISLTSLDDVERSIEAVERETTEKYGNSRGTQGTPQDEKALQDKKFRGVWGRN